MQARVKTDVMPGQLARMAWRFGLSVAIMAVFLLLLRDRLATADLSGMLAALAQVALHQWAAALAAMTISFWAVGQYDAVVHRHLATTVAPAEARRAGIAAIAIGQTVGAGVLTGALIRWRLLRGVSLWQATRISVAVTLSFLGGWAVVTGLVITLTPHAPFKGPALGAVGLGMVVAVLGGLQPHALRRLHLPNLATQSRLILLTATDTVAACVALWVLLPADAAMAIAALLPAFLVALGAGLATGTPGGVGPFEVTLLALLPTIPEPALLAAILGWRLIGYALPALLGAALAAAGPARRARGADPALRPVPRGRMAPTIAAAPRAEAGLVHQGRLALMDSRLGGVWITGRTAHTLIGVLDPIGTDQPSRATLRALAHQAQAEARVAAIYKCTGRTAATARSLGWCVLPVAREAVLDPTAFGLNGAVHATLRRKLRRAEHAGVTISRGTAHGAAERAALARLWARARHGERGFSMGRYDEAYLAHQILYEARHDGRLLGFASFHTSAQEWTLDLMRQLPDAPDGTMHALVTHAIAMAKAAGLARLSLAAAGAPGALPRPFRRMIAADDAGLQRFKQMFAPRWQPLYLTAPGRAALTIAGAEIARAISRPAPLRTHSAQDHHAEYGIASAPPAWHTGA